MSRKKNNTKILGIIFLLAGVGLIGYLLISGGSLGGSSSNKSKVSCTAYSSWSPFLGGELSSVNCYRVSACGIIGDNNIDQGSGGNTLRFKGTDYNLDSKIDLGPFNIDVTRTATFCTGDTTGKIQLIDSNLNVRSEKTWSIR